jgi:hypothetical protein
MRTPVVMETIVMGILLAGCEPAQTADALPPPPPAHYATIADAALGAGATLNGDIPFPADNPWNLDISDPVRYPVDAQSGPIIAHIGAGTGLHPDFGPAPYGIPYIVVDQSQALVPVRINSSGYPADSDVVPMPLGPGTPIEGIAPGAEVRADNDAHVIVLNRSRNLLYELWHAAPDAGGGWTADGAAVFDLHSNVVRPSKAGQCGVSSADAAGLPIFPGLVRYDEVESGAIRHALRFTVESSRKAFVPPAIHWAADMNQSNRAPMGMRVRLKASYEIPDGFHRETRVILQALKTYGMIVADNGGNWFVSGASDKRWPIEDLLHELARVKGSNFEVLRMDGLRSDCP